MIYCFSFCWTIADAAGTITGWGSSSAYNISQLVSLSLFDDDESDAASASASISDGITPRYPSAHTTALQLVHAADGSVFSGGPAPTLSAELSSAQSPPESTGVVIAQTSSEVECYTFAQFGVHRSPSSLQAAVDAAVPIPAVASPSEGSEASSFSTPPRQRLPSTTTASAFLDADEAEGAASVPESPLSPSVSEPRLSLNRTQLRGLLRVIAVTEPAVTYTQVLCSRACL